MAAAATAPPPVPPVVDGRCSFVVPGKNRRCRFFVVPGNDRCGAHREDAAEDLGERIPCPLDPLHSVYAKRLKQHLKICTKVREDRIVTQQPFFKKGVNAANGPPAETSSITGRAVLDEEFWMQRIEACFPVAVAKVLGPEADPEALLQLSVLEAAGDVSHAEKHEVQNQALAQLAASARGQDEPLILELGCGRGGLGAAVLGLLPAARCVLVDREPRRHKFENRQESREAQCLRLRMDMADFDLAALLGPRLQSLPQAADLKSEALALTASGVGPAERLEELWRSAASLQAEPWPPSTILACAKHLCGGGTDIALRALQGAGAGNAALRICFATCCHHRCDDKSYVNVPFMKDIGLCPDEGDFAQLASRAGWAVGGMGTARDLVKRRIGMMAKRILDLGRVAWLQQSLGLKDARLVNYIEKEVTPENIAIVAGNSKGPL